MSKDIEGEPTKEDEAALKESPERAQADDETPSEHDEEAHEELLDQLRARQARLP